MYATATEKFNSYFKKFTANNVASLSNRSANLCNNLPRSEASNVLHGDPSLKALLAASTAASISALSPLWISAMTSPVAGLTVWNVWPFFALCHSLL